MVCSTEAVVVVGLPVELDISLVRLDGANVVVSFISIEMATLTSGRTFTIGLPVELEEASEVVLNVFVYFFVGFASFVLSGDSWAEARHKWAMTRATWSHQNRMFGSDIFGVMDRSQLLDGTELNWKAAGCAA